MTENTKLEVFDEADIQEGKTMAGLAHIGILFFLPLVACPNSRFARFHANQTLMLILASIVVSILSGILNAIPVIGGILYIIFLLISAAIGIANIVGLIFGFMGKAFYIPLIDDIKLLNK